MKFCSRFSPWVYCPTFVYIGNKVTLLFLRIFWQKLRLWRLGKLGDSNAKTAISDFFFLLFYLFLCVHFGRRGSLCASNHCASWKRHLQRSIIINKCQGFWRWRHEMKSKTFSLESFYLFFSSNYYILVETFHVTKNEIFTWKEIQSNTLSYLLQYVFDFRLFNIDLFIIYIYFFVSLYSVFNSSFCFRSIVS